jgi:GNAT superfamily N-acetyltransferase
VIRVLADAFFHDDPYLWIVPDEGQRRLSTHAFFSIFAPACFAHGAVYMAAEARGAALWLPPGADLVPEHEADEFGAALATTAGPPECVQRTVQLFEMLGRHHPQEPHWYLAFMGVDPARQNQGIGSALLAAVLARADAEGTPAYLEASSPVNVRLYERHGFRVVRELRVADSPPLFPMWREPR